MLFQAQGQGQARRVDVHKVGTFLVKTLWSCRFMASKHASPILIVKLQWGQLAVFDDVLTNVRSVSLFVHGHLAL